MPWTTRTPVGRSLAVNGELVKFLRQRRCWTQEELAARAGYTSRVIRKAEASSGLHPDTIEVLAETLSCEAWPVAPEDLVSRPEDLAREIIDSYRQVERQVVANVHGLLHEELSVYAAGEDVGLPFAGTYKGVDGFDQFFGNYFKAFFRPDREFFRPVYWVQGNEVLLHGQEAVQAHGSNEVISSWIFIKFTFSHGKLVRYENFYDTARAALYLKSLGLKSVLVQGQVESCSIAVSEKQ